MMTKSTLYTTLLFLFCSTANAQLHYKWSQTLGSKESDNTGKTFADDDDNLYSLFQLRDTADMDPGPGTDFVYPTTSRVLALHKSDPDGNFQWCGKFHTIGTIGGTLLEVNTHQVKVSINFVDSLFYEINGQRLIQYSAPGNHTCLLTISSDGEIVDAFYFPKPYNFFVNDLFTMSDGNTLLTGSFDDTLTFPGATNLVSKGETDAFFMLINADHELIWATSLGSPDDEFVSNLTTNDGLTFYFTLKYEADLTFETATGMVELPVDGGANSLIATINLNGQFDNVITMVGEERNEINSMVVDKEGNVYVGGYFEGTINFAHPSQPPVWYTPVGSDDGFVAKYSPNGLLQWVNVYISSDYSFISTLTLERDTDLYISAGTTGSSDLDPGPGSMIVEADEDTDIFIAKLNLDGTQVFAYHFNGTDVEGIRSLLVSDSRSEVILAGFYYDTMDCDFTTEEQLIVTNGGNDFFRIVFDEENVVTALNYPSVPDNCVLYPNPASDYVRIQADQPVDFVSIHTINGQHIRIVDFNKGISGEIDVRDLSPGLYCLTLHLQDQVMTKKIVVQ